MWWAMGREDPRAITGPFARTGAKHCRSYGVLGSILAGDEVGRVAFHLRQGGRLTSEGTYSRTDPRIVGCGHGVMNNVKNHRG